MAKAKSGGGITGNKVKQVGVRLGQPVRGVSPSEAACIGIQHVTTYRYDAMKTPRPVNGGQQLGNANANAQGIGPGAGCTVSKPGSQGRH